MTMLIVAAHPDDEVLGVAGTTARLARAGEAVHILIAAEGATSRDPVRDRDARAGEVEALRKAAREAAAVVGAEAPEFLALPDNRLDGLELLDIVKPIEAVVARLRPDVVYTHHGGDLNVDHRQVFQAVLTACRPLPGAPVRRLYTFETVSGTEWSAPALGRAFAPTRFVDIADTWQAKRAALEAYGDEMRAFPHARSIEAVEALARWRGASAGLTMAEAFEVVREVVA
jgi:LmbE family N-acetylglucosaminyl deacetylase